VLQRCLLRAIDLAHAAGANRSDDLLGVEARAEGETHFFTTTFFRR
jgi:hypothetical protein